MFFLRFCLFFIDVLLTVIDPQSPGPWLPGNESAYLSCTVDGVVEPSKYSRWLNQTWFGSSVPQTNMTSSRGFNEGSWWPFWSSAAITYATSLLAFVNYNTLLQ